VEVNKLQKKAVVIDLAIPSDSNFKRKQCEKVEKYQGLNKKVFLKKVWELKKAVLPVVIGNDPQTGRMAPANPRNNSPEQCSSRNN